MDESCRNTDNAKIDLAQVVEEIKGKAERDILRAYYTSVFEMSPLVNKFATWLLAGVGGTAALTVTNIESITTIIPFPNIKIGLGILLISALFGFLEKFLSLDIQSTATQETKLRRILEESSQEFYRKIGELKLFAAAQDVQISSTVNTKRVLEKFAEAHPWYKRIEFKRKRSEGDAQKARLRRYYRQLTYAVLEFCGFLVFFMIVLFSI